MGVPTFQRSSFAERPRGVKPILHPGSVRVGVDDAASTFSPFDGSPFPTPLFSGLSCFIAMRPRHILGDVDIRERGTNHCAMGRTGVPAGMAMQGKMACTVASKLITPEPVISLNTQEGVTGVVGTDASEPSQRETESLR